jgi:hypothetical protein
MEKSTFTRANLSDVRVIMEIMRVLVEEFLYQAVTGQNLVLECLWLHPVISAINGAAS